MQIIPKRLPYLCGAILCFTLSHAYGADNANEAANWQIRGTVYDQAKQTPIADVKITLKAIDAPPVSSNANGLFHVPIAAPGNYQLVFNHPGYQSKTTEIIQVTTAIKEYDRQVALVSLIALPDIVVEAEATTNIAISKTEFSGEELQKIPGGGGDPLAALQALPGITSADDSQATFAVRGSGPQDNIAFVDFLSIGYAFHGFPFTSVLRSDLVERFDLYASSFGPEFGDVLGAVIDVKQREPREDKIGGTVNISLIAADFLIEGPTSTSTSFYFGGRRSYIDLFLPKSLLEGDEDEVQIKELPVFSDYHGKFRWRINPFHTLSLQVIGASDSIELTFPEESDEVKQDPDLVGDLASSISFDSQGIVLESDLSDNLVNKFAVAHIITRQKQTIGDTGTTSNGRIKAIFDQYYLRNQLTWYPASAHQLTFGSSIAKLDVKLDLDIKDAICTEFDPDYPNCDYSSNNRQRVDDTIPITFWYLSLNDQWQLNPALTLSLGARYAGENYLDEKFFEPRLGITAQVSNQTLLSAGWGKFHQFPDGAQVTEKIGNPNLSHLKGEHSIVGMEHFLDLHWSMKVEAYYKTFRDLVVSTGTEPPFLNEGSGRAHGLEFLLKKHPTSALSGWLSLTFSQSKRTNQLIDPTRAFPYQLDRPFMANLVASYRLFDRITLSTRFSYSDGAAYTPVIGSYTEPRTDREGSPLTDEQGNTVLRIRPNYGEFNSARLPAYHRLDIRMDLTMSRTEKFKIYLDIMNIYNRKNLSGYSWNADYTEREPQTQLGFLPFIGFRYQW